jgi:hypothetical protein
LRTEAIRVSSRPDTHRAALLTGRHGLFNCYEAFIHIIDSMFNQHAKWLKVTSQLPWRRKLVGVGGRWNFVLLVHRFSDHCDLERLSQPKINS